MLQHAIDFGTSNSLLAIVSPATGVQIAPLESEKELILKSLIYTPQKGSWFFGKEAIAEYQDQGGEGRFFRSIKKFLPEPSYTGTVIHENKVKIEELVAIFLREMRERANKFSKQEAKRVILGRPALYSLNKKDDELAELRMRTAATLAGYEEVEFCPEPLAAGLDFKVENQSERLVLIIDLGGGTSDFTLLKIHDGKFSQSDVLGLSGVFLAGDALDGLIMLNEISQHFGKNVTYKLPMGNNIISFPKGLLNKLCSPAHITHLKERDTWEFLKEIRTWSVSGEDKRQLDQLFTLVEHQLGHPIFDRIEKSKILLNQQEQALFEYNYANIAINQDLQKNSFDHYAQETLEKIVSTMMEVFTQAGLTPSEVDDICLTGGTAQSTLFRKRFEQIFGAQKLKEHRIYHSVVGGLAKYAQDQL